MDNVLKSAGFYTVQCPLLLNQKISPVLLTDFIMYSMIIVMIMLLVTSITICIMNKKEFIKKNWVIIKDIGVAICLVIVASIIVDGIEPVLLDENSPETQMPSDNLSGWHFEHRTDNHFDISNHSQTMTRNDGSPWDKPDNLTTQQLLEFYRSKGGDTTRLNDPLLSKLCAQNGTLISCPQLEHLPSLNSKLHFGSLNWEDKFKFTSGYVPDRYSIACTKEEISQLHARIVKPGGQFALGLNHSTGEKFLQDVSVNSPDKTGATIVKYIVIKALIENPPR